MSDAGTGTPTAADSVAFTEREMQMLAWAMQSLKSGPPDIDYEKLARFAGMSNPRSASNAWAKMKAKLNLATTAGATPATLKKGAAKKKAAPKGDGGDREGSESPVKKTPRKRGPKKQEVDGASPSPKKKTNGKARATTVETEVDVKSEVKKEAVDNSADEAGADATLEEI